MSRELGRLEDLPQDYRDDLKNLNLVPLWPCATLKPLLKAGEFTPIE